MSASPISRAPRAGAVFDGLTARVAKRRALSWWYAHRADLNLSAAEFFGQCRLSQSGGQTRITFYR
jgi:hypothetical protein